MNTTTVTLPLVTLIISLISTKTLEHSTTTIQTPSYFQNGKFVVVCNVSSLFVVLDGYPLYRIIGKGCISIPMFSTEFEVDKNTIYFKRVHLTLYSKISTEVEAKRKDVGNGFWYIPYVVFAIEFLRRIFSLEFEEEVHYVSPTDLVRGTESNSFEDQ